ncbi:MAG TPA: PQQ-binding-like beta-propeller repeat protein [Rhodanobacteraceae bacterium]
MRANIGRHATSAALFALSFAASAADWMQFGYDATHSGHNTAETTLGTTNVDQIQRRWQATLTAGVDGAPVYLSNVTTSGGVKNLLFLLGTNGTLMAVDAATGTVLWHHQESGQNPTTSSPAIDPGRQFVYAYGLDGYVHKYRVDNGNEVTSGGWPELVTLKTDVEKVAGSLTIATSGATTYLYVVTDGYAGDFGNYQGHLTTINLANGNQNVFNVQCSNETIHFDSGAGDCAWPMSGDTGGSGIWGRGGATFDAGTDRVYIATGNGFFDPDTFNWGDSVLAVLPDGAPRSALPDDSYTPTNFQQLEDQDTDLGSTSLVILPMPAAHATQHVGVQIGKDAKIRLIDLTNMSGTNIVGTTGGELQLLNVPQGGGGMSEQPATWVDGSGNTWLLIANRAGVSGLKLRFSNLGVPFLEAEWNHGGNARSAVVANDVLYYAAACGSSFCMNAADPVTGNVLWTSSEHLATLHWQSPIVVNGAIYIADGTHLHRFDAGDVADDTIFANGFDP